MKVTLTAVEGELQISSVNDFKLVLGKGTSLTLEIKDHDFILRDGVATEPPSVRPAAKKHRPSVSKFKKKLRIVK